MQWFPRLRKIDWLIIFGLVVGFLVLVTANLTRLPIFVDEAIYLRWAQIAWHDASWRFISLTDGKQPFYTWFVIPFLKFIDDPLYAGRFASGVSGLISVLGMGYLGYLLGNKKTGLLAMIITALSPYLFFYYRFGVMESTLVAGSIWVCNFSILLARSRRLDVAMLLGMITGATILTKSSGMFFLLLIPAAYLLDFDIKKLFTRSTFNYLCLVLVSWVIAGVMYNVQRLSPWMHMIGQKNAFFIVPYADIFNEFGRLSNNFLDVWRWQIGYTTIPVLILATCGLYLMIRTDLRKALFLLTWLLAPMVGTILLARLFAPRYVVFVTPFILYFAVYALSQIRSLKHTIIVTLIFLVMPLSLITKLITDPINYPYVSVDEGYVNGWSAGNGTKQIADWALGHMRQTGKPMTIFTEGTFGILPHGLELYVDGRVEGLTITGLYPISQIPPSHALESVKTNPETYLVLNNTQTVSQLPGLELVGEYHKFDPSYTMRLYRVLTPVK